MPNTATLLPNGEVLAAGGFGGTGLASAEFYDPGIVTATNVDGRGALDNQDHEVTFHFRANQAAESGTLGHFSFCDSAGDVCITDARIRSVSITGNTAEFSGPIWMDDGSRITFSVSVTDNGESGRSDTVIRSAARSPWATFESTKGLSMVKPPVRPNPLIR